ncbi:hypothetical protein Tco_1545950 [Tanacetum coccineum]
MFLSISLKSLPPQLVLAGDDAFHKRDHDEHQGDDGPLEGEKSAKRQKTSKGSKSARGSSSKQPVQGSKTSASERQQQQQEGDAWVEDTVIDKDEVIPEDDTPELIEEPRARYGNFEEIKYVLSLHKIHTIPFPEEDLKEKINRWVRKEFKTFNKETRLSIQYWTDSWHKRMYKINYRKVNDNPEELFSDHRIVEVVRVTTEQLYMLDYMEQIIVMRENNKPDSFSEADFKYLNKNDIEDMYYLFLNKKLGIESYRIKINLTAPTLIFPGIEAKDPYSIVDEPRLGLIYLNNKEEKRVMDLVEIVKFCDATLERVLKEVKLKIFETEFLNKAPLLGDLDLKIMKTYETKIIKCVRHREQMRR